MPIHTGREESAPFSAAQPIFIHSSFRTGSTWLWSKFRAYDQCLAYCEIFHEGLPRDDAAAMSRYHPAGWNSRHPPSAPYFLEFLPLVGKGDLYDKSMAFDRFLPEGGFDGLLSEQEKAYVDELIANARHHGKIPVLTDTRTLGRIKALASAFSGTSIFLYRNIFQQWASYSSQAAQGNNYFIDSNDRIIRSSHHNKFIKNIDEFFSDRKSTHDDEKTLLTFAIFHLYIYALALQNATITIDINALAGDQAVRTDVADRIDKETGIRLDLSDCAQKFEFSLVECRSRSGAIDIVEQFVKLIGGEVVSPAVMERVTRIKDEMLEEWERSEFYARGQRSYFTGQIAHLNEVQGRLKSTAEQSEQDRIRRDSEITNLQGGLAELQMKLEQKEAALAENTAESGMLRQQIEMLHGQNETAQAANIAESDMLRRQIEMLHGQNEAAQAANIAESDMLRRQIEMLRGQNETVVANYRAYKTRHRGLRLFWPFGRKGSDG